MMLASEVGSSIIAFLLIVDVSQAGGAYTKCAYLTISVEDYSDDFGITSDLFIGEFDSFCVASGDSVNGFESYQWLCNPDGSSMTEYFYDNLDCSGSVSSTGETIIAGEYSIGEFSGKGERYLDNKVRVEVNNCDAANDGTNVKTGEECAVITYITGVQDCDNTFSQSDFITNAFVGNEFCANFPDVPVWIYGKCNENDNVFDISYYNIVQGQNNPNAACKNPNNIYASGDNSVFNRLYDGYCVATDDIIDDLSNEFPIETDSPYLKFYTNC